MIKKSKAFKFLLGITLALAVGVAGLSVAEAYEFGAETLRVGSRGADVMEVQRVVGVEDDGVFGPMTEAAVKAWQLNNGVTPVDGIVGSITKAAMSSSPLLGTFPAGCTSNEGFSSTTGLSCAVVVGTLPAGCTSTAGFSPTTGQSCSVVTTLPAGCTSTVGYSSTTGAKCDGVVTPGTPTGPLVGGAGSVNLVTTSTDVETVVTEGSDDVKVFGLRAEALDSDIMITNLKVSLKNVDEASSYRLDRYAEEVSVYMGSTKVGSSSVSDFSRTGSLYTRTIALNNAIVREGSSNRQNFYITVSANSNIDSADMLTDDWAIAVDNIRYQDATGVIMTEGTIYGGLGALDGKFEFSSLAASGDVKVVVSKGSGSPVAGAVGISDAGSTKDVLMLEFRVKATGSDVTFDALSVIATSTQTAPKTIVDVVGELQLKRGSTLLATIDGADLISGSDVEFVLDDTYTVTAGSTDTFRVYATINDADNFDNATLKVGFDSFSPEDINGGVITDTGSALGAVQTFVLDGVSAKFISSSYTAENVADTTDGTISITLDITAIGDNEVVLKDDGSDFTYVIADEIASDEILTSSTLTAVVGEYTIGAGDTERFTFSVKFNGTSGFVQLEITDIDGTPVTNIKTQAY